MPLVKVKPTSSGRRHLVKVVAPQLHKGGPLASLTEKQKRGSGRVRGESALSWNDRSLAAIEQVVGDEPTPDAQRPGCPARPARTCAPGSTASRWRAGS